MFLAIMCKKGVQAVTWKMPWMCSVEICVKMTTSPVTQPPWSLLKWLGWQQIGKETLAAATRFWSLLNFKAVALLLHQQCILVEFCGGDEYQIAVKLHLSTPNLLEINANLYLSLALNLNMSLVKQRIQSSTYWSLLFILTGGKEFWLKSSLVFKSIFVSCCEWSCLLITSHSKCVLSKQNKPKNQNPSADYCEHSLRWNVGTSKFLGT